MPFGYQRMGVFAMKRRDVSPALYLAAAGLCLLLALVPAQAEEKPSTDPKRSVVERNRAEKSRKQQRVEEIENIQFNLIKTGAKEFGAERLSDLLEDLEAAVSEENRVKDHSLPEEYITVILTYTDREKELYLFFQQDGSWYLQTEDSAVYGNADFIEEYIDFQDAVSNRTSSAKVEIFPLTESQIQWGKQFDTYDVSYCFGNSVLRELENGLEEEEAIETTREKLGSLLKQYRYAMFHDLYQGEEEHAKRKEEFLESLKKAVNYEEVEEYYQKHQTSREQILEKGKELWEAEMVIEDLNRMVYEKFRHGEDEIHGTVCEDVAEYWGNFLMQVVYPEMEEKEGEAIEETLDEAEAFYWENRVEKRLKY